MMFHWPPAVASLALLVRPALVARMTSKAIVLFLGRRKPPIRFFARYRKSKPHLFIPFEYFMTGPFGLWAVVRRIFLYREGRGVHR
jgi:hypothetical protein